MTDHDFELRLRADLRELADEPAPATLRASVIAIPDEVPTSLSRRLWTGWRFPAMQRFAPLALAAAAALVIALVGIGLFVRPPGVGPAPGPTPPATMQQTPSPSPLARPSPSPGFSRFTSTMHGISIDYPSGWQTRPATEPWTGGELTFDSPAADVIFDPALGDRLYILLASNARSGATQPDQFDLFEDSGVCDPEGGGGGGSDPPVDGASAWYWSCDPGISGATFVTGAAVTTDNRGYLIVLVKSGDEPGFGENDFDAALQTVDLPPEAAP